MTKCKFCGYDVPDKELNDDGICKSVANCLHWNREYHDEEFDDMFPKTVPKIFQTFNSLGGGKVCKHCGNLYGYKGHTKHEAECNG